MSEFRNIKLGELATFVTKGTTPTTAGGRFTMSGVNYIKSEALSYDGRIDKSTFVHIDNVTHEKLKRSQLAKDDILFSMAGIFLGKTAMITEDLLPANTNQAVAIIRIDISKALPKYVHYYLRQKSVVEYVNNMSGQSAQPNINFEEIKSIDILLPTKTTQSKIVETLSVIDEKIDLLHRQNKTLEELAETLFRQWFVEEAEDSWEERGLDEIADFLNGLACQKFPKKANEIGLPVIKIKELRTGITEASDIATSDVPEKYLVNEGDILFSWSGSLALVLWSGVQGLLNQHLFKVSSNEFPQWFCYFWVKYHLPYFIGVAEDKATTMGHIQRHHLSSALVTVPPKGKLDEYHESIEPLFSKLKYNSKQIRTLTQLRDTLLPKLMSGEVKIN